MCEVALTTNERGEGALSATLFWLIIVGYRLELHVVIVFFAHVVVFLPTKLCHVLLG